MPLSSSQDARFRLPTRVRFRSVPDDRILPGLALAERVAGLPDIETIEYADGALPREVHVYRWRQLVCSIQCDEIVVHGLGDWDRHQVISGGWGRLVGDRVHVHLPRDTAEYDICWQIVLRAYESLSTAPPIRPRHNGAAAIWPKFSRTRLQ